MINPNQIINFNRTGEELEELILFLVCVAGKKASTVAVQLDNWIKNSGVRTNPFAHIMIRDYIPIGENETVLLKTLKKAGFGCYSRLERAFRELANSNLDLRTCTKEDLMQIHGIGRKSASCFLAWTRKGEKVAMLDTHLLKYLKAVQENLKMLVANDLLEHVPVLQPLGNYIDINIPKSTPSSKRLYDSLEQMFILICEAREVDPTEYDLEIWRYYSAKGKNVTSLDTIVETATI